MFCIYWKENLEKTVHSPGVQEYAYTPSTWQVEATKTLQATEQISWQSGLKEKYKREQNWLYQIKFPLTQKRHSKEMYYLMTKRPAQQSGTNYKYVYTNNRASN